MRSINAVVEIAVDCSKVPVIAGTGSNNTAEAIELPSTRQIPALRGHADNALLQQTQRPGHV